MEKGLKIKMSLRKIMVNKETKNLLILIIGVITILISSFLMGAFTSAVFKYQNIKFVIPLILSILLFVSISWVFFKAALRKW